MLLKKHYLCHEEITSAKVDYSLNFSFRFSCVFIPIKIVRILVLVPVKSNPINIPQAQSLPRKIVYKQLEIVHHRDLM